MSDIKTKLQAIKEKFSNPNITLSEYVSLNKEFGKIFISLGSGKDIQKENLLLVFEVDEKLSEATYNLVNKWEKGEIEPESIQVRYLGGFFELKAELKQNWEFVEKQVNEFNQLSDEDKQKRLNWMKEDLKKFEKYLLTLQKLFQKWQAKHRHEHKHPHEEGENEDESPSIDSLSQKITELQNQIEELKKNQDNSKPEIQQLINTLQKQKEEAQAQLDKLQKETSSADTSSDSKNKKGKGGKPFPIWGIFLIIFAVLAIAGVITYFVLERKEKPKKIKKEKT